MVAIAFLAALVAGASTRELARLGVVSTALLAVAAALAAAAWRGALRSARDAARAQAAHEDEQREERRQLQEQLRRRDAALRREQELLLRVQQSRRAEREWNRELRSQLQRLHEQQGSLADSGDVRELILAAALKLLEAEKGLLLASSDDDGDGRLDLVVAHGFEHDPQHSAVVQRLGREVLERDATLRDDAPAEGHAPGESLTAADREIANLVAIPLYMRDRFHGVVVCANRPGGFDEVDDDLLLALGDHAGAALQTGQLRREARDAHHGGVRMLLEALAARDPLLHRQVVESAMVAGSFAEALGLDDRDRHVLVFATLLRDVGYLALPERLLLRPGPLTLDERAVIELHPRIGFNVLRQLPALRDIALTVLYHHERPDGAGYPFGLSREEIPRLSRIVALAEAYSALTHDRPHRPRRSPEAAHEELIDGAGSQFDPELAVLFVEHLRSWKAPPSDELIEAVLEAVPAVGVDDPGAVLGAVTAADVDALTLLPTHRVFRERLHAAVEDSSATDSVALIMLQLQELERINEEASYLAGDRLLQATARQADHAAARVGGSAYRVGGRRLAIVVSCADERLSGILDQVHAEFAGGPSVVTSVALGRPGTSPEELVSRARAGLSDAVR